MQKTKVIIVHGTADMREPDPSLEGLAVDSGDEERGGDGPAAEVEELASLDPFPVVLHLVAPFRGRVLFSGFFGSAAYNLSVSAKADIDVYGVYAAPLRDVLSVRLPSSTATGTYTDIIAGQKRVRCGENFFEIDYTVRELANFAVLLLSGSPNAVEMLHVDLASAPPGTAFEAPEWAELRAMRAVFVTRRFVLSYLGWASAAVEALHKKREMYLRRKGVAHAMRIVAQVARVLETGEGPILRLPDGAERDAIIAVKRAECDDRLAEIAADVKKRIALLEEAARASTLFVDCVSEEATAALNDWLYRVRISDGSR